ncbi:MAG: SCO family protein [Pseudomonadota bacterium]
MARMTVFFAGGALAILLAGTAGYVFMTRPGDFAACTGSGVAGDIGGPFELTRHDGVRVSESEVIDGLTLMYFGYTYCPDVCPIDTVRNADVAALLDERGVEVTPVMVSVDPERDTPDVLGEYVSWMHPRMVGLTGSTDDIAAAASAYRVYYDKGEGEDYLVGHTTYTYLMAPEHGFLTFFNRDATTDQMADTISCFAEAI